MPFNYYKNMTIVALIVLTSASQAQIFRTVTPNGQVIYTDSADTAYKVSEGNNQNITVLDQLANRSQIPTSIVNQAQEPTLLPYSTNIENVSQVTQVASPANFTMSQKGDYQLTIVNPEIGMVYRRPAPIVVDVDVKPALKASDRIVYFINNKHIATTQATHYEIPTLDYLPEKYHLTVKIENAKGDIIANQSREFYLLQNNVHIQKQRQKAKQEAAAKEAYDNLPWYKKLSVNIGL